MALGKCSRDLRVYGRKNEGKIKFAVLGGSHPGCYMGLPSSQESLPISALPLACC